MIERILVANLSHTDLGYTDHPATVERQQLHGIDRAIDLAERTADLPAPARFRWTCELASTALRYLRERPPERVRSFLSLHREGRMAIGAMPFHWTPLLSPCGMLHALRVVADLRDEFGASVTSAIQNDVNGCASLWADLLPAAGVHGLTMGVNPYRGMRPEPDPDVFLWRGPRGGALHVALVPHYAHGITLYGIGDMATATRQILAHVRRLESRSDYPWRFLYLQVTHPSRHDNGPPYEDLPGFVMSWNEAGHGPPMQLATVDTLFEAIRSEPAETIGERHGDWPDWWADGVGSSPYETALHRATNRLVPVAASLEAWVGDGPGEGGDMRALIDDVFDHALRYDEHTWGSFASVSHPHSAHARALWNDKANHAYRAFAFVLEALAETGRNLTVTLLGLDTTRTRNWRLPILADAESNRYLLINPSAWTRHVALELPADPAAPRPYAVPAALLGEDPSPPFEGDRTDNDDRYLAATLPPWGYRVVSYRRARHETRGEGDLESDWYRLRVDPVSGGVLSWVDKELDVELAGTAAPWRLGQPVWEGIESPSGRHALFELDLDDPMYGTLRRDAPLVRVGARSGSFVPTRLSPLGPQVSVELELPEASSLSITYRLPVHRKAVEIEYRMLLEPRESPRSVYVPFPLALEVPQYHLDLNGVAQQVPSGTLTGGWTDSYAVQGWAAVASAKTAVFVAPLDAPLVQLGGIRTGRWGEEPVEPFPGIVSWPVNNYWDTNFKASQGGALRMRYALGSAAGCNTGAAARFASESSPALAFHAPNAPDVEGRFLSVEPEGAAQVHVRRPRDGRGMIVVVQGLDEGTREIVLGVPRGAVRRAWLCSSLEEDQGTLPVESGRVRLPLGRGILQARVEIEGDAHVRHTGAARRSSSPAAAAEAAAEGSEA